MTQDESSVEKKTVAVCMTAQTVETLMHALMSHKAWLAQIALRDKALAKYMNETICETIGEVDRVKNFVQKIREEFGAGEAADTPKNWSVTMQGKQLYPPPNGFIAFRREDQPDASAEGDD